MSGAAGTWGRRAAPPAVHLVGNVNLDVVLGPVEPWPRAGTERIVPRQELRAGGAAGVAALALQGLGVPFRLHARVADDAFGALLRERMGPAGEQLMVVPGTTAYSVGIRHPDGDRTFLTYLGHLAALDVDAIGAALAAHAPGLVLVCGYFLLPPLRQGGARALLEAARQAGHRALFDPGWPSEGFNEGVRRELDALLPLFDVVLPNEAEALGWTGAIDLEEAVPALQRFGPLAVVKRGPAGASWWEDGRLRTAPPEAGARATAGPVGGAVGDHVADTVGAGDCFNAALLASLRGGADLGTAVRAGVRYASLVIGRQPRDYRR